MVHAGFCGTMQEPGVRLIPSMLSLRICPNVVANPTDGLLAVKDVIVETGLPDFDVAPAVEFVDPAARGGLEAADDRREGVSDGISEFPKWLAVVMGRGRHLHASVLRVLQPDQPMDVIGHHDKLVQLNVVSELTRSCPFLCHDHTGFTQGHCPSID